MLSEEQKQEYINNFSIIELKKPLKEKTINYDFEAKALRTKNLYENIKNKGQLSKKAKSYYLAKINTLRPTISELQKKYKTKLSDSEVLKLVNKHNYNYLPEVKITKTQYKILINACFGIFNHENLIAEKGFFI